MTSKSLFGAISGLVFALCASSAHAALIVSWSIDLPTQVAGPSDILTIDSTIRNDNSSDSNINLETAIVGTAVLLTDFEAYYDFVFGTSGNFFEQFNGIVLAPGDSYGFVYGTLTPFREVAPGTYASGDLKINTDPPLGGYLSATNGPFQVTVVPITPALWLFGSGLIGLIGVARQKKS